MSSLQCNLLNVPISAGVGAVGMSGGPADRMPIKPALLDCRAHRLCVPSPNTTVLGRLNPSSLAASVRMTLHPVDSEGRLVAPPLEVDLRTGDAPIHFERERANEED